MAETRTGHHHALVEWVQWRGDNLLEVADFGGTLRFAGGTLELYDDEEFVAVPVGHWIVRYSGDHTEHWLMDRLTLEEPGAELEPTDEEQEAAGLIDLTVLPRQTSVLSELHAPRGFESSPARVEDIRRAHTRGAGIARSHPRRAAPRSPQARRAGPVDDPVVGS